MTTSMPSTTLSHTWDLVADAYVADVMPHFEQFARFALDAVDLHAGEDLVDVACGPGTVALQGAQRGAQVRALDFSPATIAHLKVRAASQGLQVEAVVGDGQAMPWGDASADVVASLFGLMFFPDVDAGLRECVRVLRPGGRVVVTSWVPMADVPLMNDAVATLMAAAGLPSRSPIGSTASEDGWPALSRPDDYRRRFGAVGFEDIVVEERSVLVPFKTPTELLRWMARSSAPVVAMREAMGEAAFEEVFLRWQVAMMERCGAKGLTLPLVALMGTARRSS